MRIVTAFLIAPMVVPVLLVLGAYFSGSSILWDIVLGTGAIFGYGFAVLLGIPSYFFYFRNIDKLTVHSFLRFTIVASIIFFWLCFVMMVHQDGMLVLLTASFWAYNVIFFLSTGVSVVAFYFIAFHRFSMNCESQ